MLPFALKYNDFIVNVLLNCMKFKELKMLCKEIRCDTIFVYKNGEKLKEVLYVWLCWIYK